MTRLRLPVAVAVALVTWVPALALFSGAVVAQMRHPMPMERERSPGAFDLGVTLSPESVRAGEEVIVTARITSKTAPHARVSVTLYRDGEKVEEVQGVVPPFSSEAASFRWGAEPGTHTLAVVLASALGIEYARWEQTLEVKP